MTPSASCDETEAAAEDGEGSGVFERPLSLKGQRHIFLFKCRHRELQAVIDEYGCWNLRLATLDEKWPCLVVYCARDRDTWMMAFRKIQKLERSDFIRKRVAESVHSVMVDRMEDLTNQYGNQ